MPSWTRWKTSRSAAGERPRYSTTVGRGEGEEERRADGRVASGFMGCYVLGETRTACDGLLGEYLLFVCGDFCARRPGSRGGIPPLLFRFRTAVWND